MTLTEIGIILGKRIIIKESGCWFFASFESIRYGPMPEGLTVPQQIEWKEAPLGFGFSEKVARKKLAKELRGKLVFMGNRPITMPPKITRN